MSAYNSYPPNFVVWYRKTYKVRHPDVAVRRLNAMTHQQLHAVQVEYRTSRSTKP